MSRWNPSTCAVFVAATQPLILTLTPILSVSAPCPPLAESPGLATLML